MSTRFGRYEVVCKLGEGAMAAVFLARDPVLARFVAVKVLHGNVAAGKVALQRFFNEAKTVANVRNPHLVEVFDFGKEGKDYYLVMEFVDGPSLHGILRQLPLAGPAPGNPPPAGAGSPSDPGEPLADAVTAALLVQAAEGLDLAASHGVVHRDIKPENLLINTQGYLKIGDFGIAHLQDETLTRTGAVLGSPLFMSPEQVRGAKPITSQSDMFSLGAVLYRCLTGSPPFTSRTLKELYLKIAREPHIPILDRRPDLARSLVGLVETLLQKDPVRRGGGPRWLRAELRAYLLAQGIGDPMELVGLHLREQAQRKLETTWRDSGAEALPRTVAATSPLAGRDAEPVIEEPAPDYRFVPAPWRTSFGFKTAACLAAIGATSVAAYLVWTLGRAPRVKPSAEPVVKSAVKSSGKSSEKVFPERTNPAGKEGGMPGTGPAGGRAQGGGFQNSGSGGAATAGWSPQDAGESPGAGNRPSPEPADPAADKGPSHGTASLLVQSSPPFAEVFLDGRSVGVTPVRLKGVDAGAHRLAIKGRSQISLDTVLQVMPGRRTLRVRLDPGDVALYEDGE